MTGTGDGEAVAVAVAVGVGAGLLGGGVGLGAVALGAGVVAVGVGEGAVPAPLQPTAVIASNEIRTLTPPDRGLADILTLRRSHPHPATSGDRARPDDPPCTGRRQGPDGLRCVPARGERPGNVAATPARASCELARLRGRARRTGRPRQAAQTCGATPSASCCMSSTCASYSSSGRWLRATNSTGTGTASRTASSASTSSSGVPAYAVRRERSLVRVAVERGRGGRRERPGRRCLHVRVLPVQRPDRVAVAGERVGPGRAGQQDRVVDEPERGRIAAGPLELVEHPARPARGTCSAGAFEKMPSARRAARRIAGSAPPPTRIGIRVDGVGRTAERRELVDRALVGERLAAPRLRQDLEGLLHRRAATAHVGAEAGVLDLRPARARARARAGRGSAAGRSPRPPRGAAGDASGRGSRRSRSRSATSPGRGPR